MSDAVHVTIDDILFIIGPNTAHISSLSVIKRDYVLYAPSCLGLLE